MNVLNRLRENIKASAKYFLMFLILILYCEILLKFIIYREFGFPYFLLFIPAEALFFTLFCGLFKKIIPNRIITFVIIFLITVFYIIQLLYYRQFGSPLSVSFIGMGGEAIGDFWWAFESTLLKSIPYILLFLLPLVASIVFLFTGTVFGDYICLTYRVISIALTIALWICAVGGLSLVGRDRHSAYSVFNNAYSDTETSVNKLGVLTTGIVEAGAYFLGINSNNSEESFAPAMIEVPVEEVADASVDNKISISEESAGNPKADEEVTKEEPDDKYHINEAIDFEYLKTCTEDSEIQALCDYFASKSAAKENEYTGLFEGYNLIYICAESFTTYGINEKLTPVLWEMSQNGVVLKNFYSSFKNTTTNGEFAYCVSLWPDVSRKAADGNAVGSFACSCSNLMPYGLGNIFNAIDVPTYAYHGYVSSYYNRGESWPNLGYKNIKFMYEGLSFANKWSPTDSELIEQTVDDFISQDRFFAYYMTFSGHGDYNANNYIYQINNREVRDKLGENSYTEAELTYLCGNYELELALEYLVERLKESNKLDNTVIVIAGDHIPYNFTDEEMADMSRKSGLSFDYNFDKYKSTCIIYNSGLTEPIVNDEYCCTVDVLPTVLNLMRIEYDSRLIAGNDVFGSSFHRARLYNGNLITKYVNYNAANGKAVWKGSAENWVDAQKEAYLNNITAYSDNEYKVSLKLMDKDFYRFVWDNLE